MLLSGVGRMGVGGCLFIDCKHCIIDLTLVYKLSVTYYVVVELIGSSLLNKLVNVGKTYPEVRLSRNYRKLRRYMQLIPWLHTLLPDEFGEPCVGWNTRIIK